MSYPSIAPLRAAVRADFPIEAHNAAWTRYADFADREPFCHRLARSDVRRSYKRDLGGIWRLRPTGDRIVQET